jgi:hypothetical protein
MVKVTFSISHGGERNVPPRGACPGQEEPLPKLDVDWVDLELAFRDATGTENLLDLESGEVLCIVPGFEDEGELREQVGKDPGRYLELSPVDVGFARSIMGDFLATLPNGPLREELTAGFKKIGGLTRCMELLDENAATRGAFDRYEQARFWAHVDEVLRYAGVQPQSPPPTVDLFEGEGLDELRGRSG